MTLKSPLPLNYTIKANEKNMKTLKNELQNNNFLHHLQSNTLQELEDLLEPIIYRKPPQILENNYDFFIPLSSKVRIYHKLPFKLKFIELLNPGDVFIRFSDKPLYANFNERTQLYGLNKEDFNDLLHHFPDFHHNVTNYYKTNLDIKHQQLDSYTNIDLDTRLMGVIITFSEKYGIKVIDGIHVPHGLTQADLADYVGVARETLNKALNRLVNAQIIRIYTRKLLIINPDKLWQEYKINTINI